MIDVFKCGGCDAECESIRVTGCHAEKQGREAHGHLRCPKCEWVACLLSGAPMNAVDGDELRMEDRSDGSEANAVGRRVARANAHERKKAS